MMKTITSPVVPIPRRDIDTDQIIPAEFLTGTVKTGLGQHLFCRVRESAEDFSQLNAHDNAAILVARQNFGCGSSREHAAWALHDFGIRVVIAPSFADIFKSNAMKNGLLPVELPDDIVEQILSDALATETYDVTVDLPAQTVTLPDGSSHPFQIDPYRKTCLTEGMDDMDYLFSHIDEIKMYDEKRANHLFFNVQKV